MGGAKTTKKLKRVNLEGNRTLIDPNTGERFEVGHVAIAEVDANFSKIWVANLLFAIEEFSSAAMDILFWLVRETELTKGTNTIIMTIREVAKATNKSTQTVHRVLKILERNDVIRRKTGVIIVNPEVVYKGTHQGRMNVLMSYKSVENVPLEEEAIEARIERRALQLKRIGAQYEYLRNLIEKDLEEIGQLKKEKLPAAE